MKYHIYPPIGIARVGNSLTGFFIGPELERSPGVEITVAGELTVSSYKDGDSSIKRQGARFRVFEDAEDGSPMRPVDLNAGGTIEWTVQLVNRKNAVSGRSGGPPRASAAVPGGRRPSDGADAPQNTIDGGSRTISGANANPEKFDSGSYQGVSVPLGECFTDANQNLIVLGGFGDSASVAGPSTLGSFYDNPNWYDDTSDGVVSAKVDLGNGPVDVTPARIAVAPPDFAPGVRGVVTLYDILFQVGVEHFGLVAPATPSFVNDIFPILQRASRLQWVNLDITWTDISKDWENLSKADPAELPLRNETRNLIIMIEEDEVLSNYSITATQKLMLDQWVNGNFVEDWVGTPASSTIITPEGLTRAALDACVGQGFFPGIEIGIILRDTSLYTAPFDFRINDNSLRPGDLSALMAVPWQADFWDCRRNWWPSQRPDDVRLATDDPTTDDWTRGINSRVSLVSEFGHLGFVTPDTDLTGGEVFVETERDPNF